MKTPRRPASVIVALAAASLLGGCGHRAPPDTGARQAAKDYLDAFVRQDWNAAYGVLDQAGISRDTAEQYTQWVIDYRHRLGFEVEGAVIATSREEGDKARVQADLQGHAGSKKRSKQVVLNLRRESGQWRVELPLPARAQTAPGS